MSTIEKISVALTPDLASMVRGAVDNGYYASTSELIREALRDWKKKQIIRGLWQEGIDSGSAGVLDMDEIKREANKRYAKERKKPKS